MFDKLIRKLQKIFGYDTIYQLFLKYSEGNLDAIEQTKIDKWVKEHEIRKLLFVKLNEIIEFQKRLSSTEPKELQIILKDLKKKFPEVYADFSENTGRFLLEQSITGSLSQLNFEITHKIVYGLWWISILAFIVRFGIIAFIIIFIILLYKTGCRH